MNANIINKLNLILETLNQTQKEVAIKLSKNNSFQLSEQNSNLIIKNIQTGQQTDFIEYIKSICGC